MASEIKVTVDTARNLFINRLEPLLVVWHKDGLTSWASLDESHHDIGKKGIDQKPEGMSVRNWLLACVKDLAPNDWITIIFRQFATSERVEKKEIRPTSKNFENSEIAFLCRD